MAGSTLHRALRQESDTGLLSDTHVQLGRPGAQRCLPLWVSGQLHSTVQGTCRPRAKPSQRQVVGGKAIRRVEWVRRAEPWQS